MALIEITHLYLGNCCNGLSFLMQCEVFLYLHTSAVTNVLLYMTSSSHSKNDSLFWFGKKNAI